MCYSWIYNAPKVSIFITKSNGTVINSQCEFKWNRNCVIYNEWVRRNKLWLMLRIPPNYIWILQRWTIIALRILQFLFMECKFMHVIIKIKHESEKITILIHKTIVNFTLVFFTVKGGGNITGKNISDCWLSLTVS